MARYNPDLEMLNAPWGECFRLPQREDGWRIRKGYFRKRNVDTFMKYVLPKYQGVKCSFLNIGILEAMQECWLLEFVLTHPESEVVCVDPWVPHYKFKGDFMEQAFKNAVHNLSRYPEHKWKVIRAASQDFLSMYAPCAEGLFDCTIIDGDHTADAVYQDAVNCLTLLKPGGWMLFDDVRNWVYKRKDHVRHGIERFVGDYGSRVRLAWQHRFMDCYEVVE